MITALLIAARYSFERREEGDDGIVMANRLINMESSPLTFARAKRLRLPSGAGPMTPFVIPAQAGTYRPACRDATCCTMGSRLRGNDIYWEAPRVLRLDFVGEKGPRRRLGKRGHFGKQWRALKPPVSRRHQAVHFVDQISQMEWLGQHLCFLRRF
jgi:hypothetical protein